MELTKEQYEQLPEFARGAFAESEGKYIPVKDAALKATLDNLDKEKKSLESKVGELTKAEQNRLAELEKAKQEARDEAIKEAANKGNWEEQEKLLREKFEDELKREKESVRGEVTKEFTVKQEREKLKSDIDLLASKLAKNPDSEKALKVLISNQMKLDENGQRTYFGEDGSALSITDIEAFGNEFANSKVVAPLVKADIVTSGDGVLNGGSTGSAQGGHTNAAAEEAKSKGDTLGYLNAALNGQ